jgi:formylglycine-generating enzyme required for sulfatase activity
MDAQSTNPPPQPEHRPDVSRPSFARWLTQNWGWSAVLFAGVLLVVASIFFLLSVLLPVGSSPAEQLPGKPTPTVLAATTIPPNAGVQPTAASTEDQGLPATPTSVATNHGYEMVLVPAGAFRMGSTDEELGDVYAICNPILGEAECRSQGFEEEQPPHDVTLDAYYIDVYEVTNEQYALFMNEMGNQSGGNVQWYEAADDKARIQFVDGKWQPIEAYARHPGTEMTWYGAQAFCEWRGGRLPTEAEWEKAARWNPTTGEVSVYPWGATQPDAQQANYALTGNNTRPVGSFEAGKSPLGPYDMAGNVFEWVADWYAGGGYGTSDPVNDPTGPAEGTTKILRGGSWGDNAFFLRTANRGTLLPTLGLNYVGFRCVKEPADVAP